MRGGWFAGPLRRFAAGRRFRRAHALGRSGRWADAVGAWREGLELRDDLASAWLGYAEALEAIGRQARAVAALERAAATAGPREAAPFHRLGLARRLAGDFEGAIAAFDQALERDPKHTGAAEAREALAPVAARLEQRRAAAARPDWAADRQRAG